LKQEKTKRDLFKLPREALDIIFGHSETCLSEFDLFKAISDRIEENKLLFKDNNQSEELKEIAEEENSRQSYCSHNSLSENNFLKGLLKYVRLPLINMKQLVTEIKFSGYFDDQLIFEALQF
jgi:hypothetical protein